ncbi:MAG: NAD(P)/FAD-dependent oxidoreductase [Chloroflexia bacterium]
MWADGGGTLVVCGAGATGIEAAAEFASAYPKLRVHLLARRAFGEFGQFLGTGIAKYMRKSLEELGVVIHEHTIVTEVGPGEVRTSGGTLAYDVCLWTGGFIAPPLAREAGLAVNERGQVLVDPFMRSVSHPEVYAVGDSAWPVEEPGVKVRMSAFTATIMGAHGADSVAAALKGETPKPLSFVYMGQGIALGRNRAVGFGLSPDDKPKSYYFTGRVGYGIRESAVRVLGAVPGIEKRRPGSFPWLGKGRYEASKRQARRGVRVDSRP